MKKLIKYIFILMLLISMIAGCDNSPTKPIYKKEIAVFGFLYGNLPLNSDRAILITYTQPLAGTINLQNIILNNAQVAITESATGKAYQLKDSLLPGLYFNTDFIPKPDMTYQLQIEVDSKTVTAVTTVPPVLNQETQLSAARVDSFYFDNISRENPIFLNCENPNQVVLVDIYCNEMWDAAVYISPFFDQDKPEDQDEYNGGSNGEPQHIFALAKYSELISDYHPGKIVVDWYSSMIQFYGSYTLQVLSIDDNYHKFLTSGEYPEFKAGVTGGVGVLGSVCGVTYKLEILKR
jgi:hypothetical protein